MKYSSARIKVACKVFALIPIRKKYEPTVYINGKKKVYSNRAGLKGKASAYEAQKFVQLRG